MSVIESLAVSVTGDGTTGMVFLHGYGCDSTMWRKVTPAFTPDFKVVTYDLMGYGRSQKHSYDIARYATLDGHASDLIDVLDALNLRDVIVVGHSVSAMTAALAANRRPDLIQRLVMVCPSPGYVNDDGYTGGFDREDIVGLLEILDTNYLGWAKQMAPQIMGVPDAPELGEELSESFCRTEPDIAKHFARVTFLSDHRSDLKILGQSTLVLQCRDDLLVPPDVWSWMKENMPAAEIVVLEATGHCPHVSAPRQTTEAITHFLNEPVAAA